MKMSDEEHGTTFLTSYKTMKSDFDEVDDGLQEINNYQIPSMSTKKCEKGCYNIMAVIQHFKKSPTCIPKKTFCSNTSSSEGIAVVDGRLTKENNYFEVEIVNLGVNEIGVISKSYGVDGAPGWREGSVAFHVDDGRLFKSEGRGPAFGPIANIGDIIGCGILFPSIDRLENFEVEVFFTINGEKTDSSNEDSLLSKSMFKISSEENVLINALQFRMEHCPGAADAAWEYYNLKRSFDTL
ncbi:unnamed protein product [Mytilus edulis]|uniref:SPRY domain-containing protein n=1 Tax=Mytilus edulis TaxID=6550 RepID=A0A8S3S218_MYTED|nr:unnamed protein product [Mytilus edulis]